MFGFLASLISAILKFNSTMKKRLKEKGVTREAFKQKVLGKESKDKSIGVRQESEDNEESKKLTLWSRFLALLSFIILFFEVLPLFASVIIGTIIVIVLLAVAVVILQFLAILSASIEANSFVYDFENIQQQQCSDITVGTGGILAWTDEELSARGMSLTEYEKNIYRLGIFARKAIEGY